LRRVPDPAPVILAFGLKPERLVDAEGRIDAFLEVPGQDHAHLLVEAVGSGLKGGGAVLAIVPTWFAPEGLMRLEMARSILDTDRLAVHRTGLPPLAGAALASLASSVGPHLPGAGVLASLLPRLEDELHVFTWLGSVSGLSVPSPTLGQHMASLTPGTAFGVSSWPEPTVHRLRGDDAVVVPIPELARPSALAVAPRAPDTGWVLGSVNAALGGLPVRTVEPTPQGPDWWGTQKLVESVAYPVDPAQLAADLLAELEPWVCRWCRELIASTPCPLCGHRGRPARGRRRPAAAA
jgi:hypothetical protein